MKLAINLSTVFTEQPLLKRFAAAAARGFDTVEIQFPYQESATDLAAAAEQAGVRVHLINMPVGDFLDGGNGVAAHPERTDLFGTALDTCEPYIRALKPTCVNVLAGRRAAGYSTEACLATYADNLMLAAQRFAPLNVNTVFEALNAYDVAGSLVSDLATQCRIMDNCGSGGPRLQIDFYHMATSGEDIVAFLRNELWRVQHIQFADVPGRGEPGSGQLDFISLFELLRAGNYAGCVAAEYRPSAASEASFGWLQQAPFNRFLA